MSQATTKKGGRKTKAQLADETDKKLIFDQDKKLIIEQLNKIYSEYNSNNVPGTIKTNIRTFMSIIADIMKMSPGDGKNASPKFKVEVLNAVKDKFNIDSKEFTLAFNYANQNAEEMTTRANTGSAIQQQKAREKRGNIADEIVDEVDDEIDYSQKDEQILKSDVKKIVDKVEEKPSILKQIVENTLVKTFDKTDKKETQAEEQKIINLVEEKVKEITTQTEMIEKSEKPTQTKMIETSEKPTQTQAEPIIERAYVSEQQQMKLDSEVPSNFTSSVFNQKPKEGKTKMSDLNEAFTNPIQYPEQLLKWVNLVGGWEQYNYNRSKFGLVDDVKGDAEYLENMKRAIITVCGDDIGVQDLPVGNINQAVKELMIMKNCYYIYKLKSSLPPQYGLIVNANKLMTFADILGKGASSADILGKGASSKPGEVKQKPVVKGKERIEFEDERKSLIQQSLQSKEEKQSNIPTPDITKESIHKSQIQRGNRGLMQINMESLNKRTVNQGSMIQADAIARGIKIMRPKKQFGRY